MQPYRYQPLRDPSEIRILALLPGQGEEDVRCELQHRTVDEESDFEALSYAWGDDSKPRRVLCNGNYIPVTENLYTALLHLRYQYMVRHIWADAICINQASDDEKNHQLPLMGAIYSKAARSLVWIGEDRHGDAKRIFDVLRPLFKLPWDREALLSNILACAPCFSEETRPREMIADFSTFVSPIFRGKAWFNRLWVVQEYVLSRNPHLIFGTETIPLVALSIWMGEASSLPGFKIIGGAWHDRSFVNFLSMRIVKMLLRANTMSILAMMRVLTDVDCRDPRDYVYGLLGIADAPGFTVDYTLNVDETFQKFALWALKTFPYFLVFSFARGRRSTEWDLPSWAPAPGMESLPVPLPSSTLIKPQETKTIAVRYKLLDNITIALSGCMLDTVSDMVSQSLRSHDAKELRGILLQCSELAQVDMNCIKTERCKDEKWKRFARAMTMDPMAAHYMGETTAPLPMDSFFSFFSTWTDPTSQDGADNYHLIDSPPRETYGDFAASMLRERRFCRTHKGMLAWVPKMAVSGDSIYATRGALVPFVLQPGDGRAFRLVGECWLEGMMDQGALDSTKLEWEEISLV